MRMLHRGATPRLHALCCQRRGAAPTLIGETKKQFLQLMQDDVGQEIALLRSLQEYQVAEAGAVVAGEKLGEARQAGKQGLNKGASTLANTTQKVHQETLGKVAQTETFKKVEDVVVEKVVGFEKKQVYFFREAMPEVCTWGPRADTQIQFRDLAHSRVSVSERATALCARMYVLY